MRKVSVHQSNFPANIEQTKPIRRDARFCEIFALGLRPSGPGALAAVVLSVVAGLGVALPVCATTGAARQARHNVRTALSLFFTAIIIYPIHLKTRFFRWSIIEKYSLFRYDSKRMRKALLLNAHTSKCVHHILAFIGAHCDCYRCNQDFVGRGHAWWLHHVFDFSPQTVWRGRKTHWYFRCVIKLHCPCRFNWRSRFRFLLVHHKVFGLNRVDDCFPGTHGVFSNA